MDVKNFRNIQQNAEIDENNGQTISKSSHVISNLILIIILCFFIVFTFILIYLKCSKKAEPDEYLLRKMKKNTKSKFVEKITYDEKKGKSNENKNEKNDETQDKTQGQLIQGEGEKLESKNEEKIVIDNENSDNDKKNKKKHKHKNKHKHKQKDKDQKNEEADVNSEEKKEKKHKHKRHKHKKDKKFKKQEAMKKELDDNKSELIGINEESNYASPDEDKIDEVDNEEEIRSAYGIENEDKNQNREEEKVVSVQRTQSKKPDSLFDFKMTSNKNLDGFKLKRKIFKENQEINLNIVPSEESRASNLSAKKVVSKNVRKELVHYTNSDRSDPDSGSEPSESSVEENSANSSKSISGDSDGSNFEKIEGNHKSKPNHQQIRRKNILTNKLNKTNLDK
jgi:hypothetical protein